MLRNNMLLPLLCAVSSAAFAAAPLIVGDSFHFEPNMGQTDASVRYVAKARGIGIYVTSSETVFALPGGDSVRMKISGARNGRLEPEEKLPGEVNYLIGNDPRKWRTRIPRYAKLRRRNAAQGVDFVYYGNGRNLEYDFVVSPGADPDKLELVYEGASSVRTDGADVVIRCASGEIRQHKPLVYQEVAGKRVEIAATYRIRGERVGFELARYDRSKPLVIDPVVTFSTRLGGSSEDSVARMALDPAGNAYVTGLTRSANFPVKNALVPFGASGSDAFVAKFTNQGSLVYSTYLGGISEDSGQAIAADASGSAYVTGSTFSANFPVANAFRNTHSNTASGDAFVAKISPNGDQLTFSTFFGGTGADSGSAIAVDGVGAIYVAGSTTSTDYPTVNAFQNRLASTSTDAFLAKFNAAGAALTYSTYLGGLSTEAVRGLAVDAAGAAYVLGDTNSTNFPVANALQANFNLGLNTFSTDLFVTKFAPYLSGNVTLAYSTFLGGSSSDNAGGLFVDATGAAYVAANAQSADYPVVNPYKARPPQSFLNGVVTKLAPAGNALVFSTFLADIGNVAANAVAADSNGNVFVAGSFNGLLPIIDPPAGVPPYPAGGLDAIVVQLNPAGNAAVMSAMIGGTSTDSATTVAVDASGAIWLAGSTSSLDFPSAFGLPAPQQSTFFNDGFIMKIVPGTSPSMVNITGPGADQIIPVSGVTISWQPVPGSTGYGLRVYRDPGSFTSTLGAFTGSLAGGDSTSTLVTLPDGDYVAAVRSCIGGGFTDTDCGPYSFRRFKVRQPVPFTLPVITAPLFNAVLPSSTQTLSWLAAPGATSYEVRVLSGGALELQLRVPASELSTIYSFRSGSYQMNVRACSAACGGFSAAVNFTINLPAVADTPPVVSSAVVGADGRLTASWNAVTGADLYLLQVVQPAPAGPGGGALTVASARVSTTTATVPVPPGEASVFVAACNGSGCRGNSGGVTIRPTSALGTAPTVAQPANGSQVDGPVVLIAWNRVAGDNGSNTTYRLFVQDLGRQATALDVLTTSNFHGAYFSPGSRYDVQVIANPGPAEVKSAASGFSVRGSSPSFATLVGPAGGSRVREGNIGIGWTPVLNSALYQYFVTTPGRADPVFSGVTSGTEVRVPVKTVSGADTLYNAIVRACSPNSSSCDAASNGGWLGWSNVAGGSGVAVFTVTP